VGAGVAALAVLAFLAFLVLRPDGGGSASDLGSLAIVDGERLNPPFEVTRDGADVLINGVLAQSLAPVENASSVGAPSAADDVFTIVEQAAQAADDAESLEAAFTAALALLETHPATF